MIIRSKTWATRTARVPHAEMKAMWLAHDHSEGQSEARLDSRCLRHRDRAANMTIVVTICGAGNGAHVMMAHLGSAPGVETRVLEIRRADNLKAALAEAGNVVMCHNQVGDDATT